MQNLMKPFIKLDEAQCHECMHPINVYDFEANDIKLSQEGIPVTTNLIRSTIIGVCPNCGKTYEVERSGIRFAITSQSRREFKGAIKDEQQEQTLQNKFKTSSDNEFGYF